MRGFVVLILSLFDYLSLGGGKHALAFKAFLIFAAAEPLRLCLYLQFQGQP